MMKLYKNFSLCLLLFVSVPGSPAVSNSEWDTMKQADIATNKEYSSVVIDRSESTVEFIVETANIATDPSSAPGGGILAQTESIITSGLNYTSAPTWFIITLLLLILVVAIITAIILFTQVKQHDYDKKWARATLLDISGTTSSKSHPIDKKPVVLGRIAGRDTHRFTYIIVRAETVGRRHAMIEFRDGVFWLCDQGSINGTFINDVRIEEHPLCNEDRIHLHDAEFEFVCEMDQVDDEGEGSDTHGPTIMIDKNASKRKNPDAVRKQVNENTRDQNTAGNVAVDISLASDEELFGDSSSENDNSVNSDIEEAAKKDTSEIDNSADSAAETDGTEDTLIPATNAAVDADKEDR